MIVCNKILSKCGLREQQKAENIGELPLESNIVVKHLLPPALSYDRNDIFKFPLFALRKTTEYCLSGQKKTNAARCWHFALVLSTVYIKRFDNYKTFLIKDIPMHGHF